MYSFVFSLKGKEVEHIQKFYDEKFSNSSLILEKSQRENIEGGLALNFAEIIVYFTAIKESFEFAKFILDWLKERKKDEVKITYRGKGKNKNIELEVTSDMTEEEIKQMIDSNLKTDAE